MVKSKSTDYFRNLSKDKSHLIKQYEYNPLEEVVMPYESQDPLGENRHKVTSKLIHRYKDRVLLLVTDFCSLYCRHCFRKEFIESEGSVINDREIKEACKYITENRDVHEILLSGGDPLTLNPIRLDYILSAIKDVRPDIVIRIGSRVPIVDPDRVTVQLVSVLKKYTPVWLSVQCNHVDELSLKVKGAVDLLIDSGINIVNQAVLLKGVNDSVKELKNLCHKLLEFRIKPYYLFQGDLAIGTKHLRVPITKGLEIVKRLRCEISGLAMPTYAVDIPCGGGKVPLTSDYITGEDDNWIYLTNSEGFTGKYPKE